MRRWIVFALLLGACDPTEAADPCEARLRALEARLTSAAATAEPSGAPSRVRLPRSEAGAPLTGTPPLLVIASDVVFAGRGVGGSETIDRTAETLRQDLRSWARAHDIADDAPFPIAVWSAPDESVDALVGLLRHAPSNARFALLVRGPPRAALDDEPTWVEPALRSRSGRPESRRQHLEAAWTRATEGCPAAGPHMPTPAPLAPAGPPLGAPAIDSLMSALEACGCEGTHLAAIEAVTTRALVDAAGPVLRLPATLRFGPPTDDAAVVESPPDQTIAALVQVIAARRGALWVRAD